MIRKSDVHVVLDDVQFEKQSWQSRNKIPSGWLGVKIKHGQFGNNIKDTMTSKQAFLGPLSMTINYLILEWLDIDTEIHFSSKLKKSASRQVRLINLCKHFGADEYLSPIGSKEYLDVGLFNECGIKVTYQDIKETPDDYTIMYSILTKGPSKTKEELWKLT